MTTARPATGNTGATKEPPPGNGLPPAGWPVPHLALVGPGAIDGIHRLSEMQMNLARFAAESAQRNVRLLAALASCRSPAEYVEAWKTAATEAIAAYADEAARIVDLGRR